MSKSKNFVILSVGVLVTVAGGIGVFQGKNEVIVYHQKIGGIDGGKYPA